MSDPTAMLMARLNAGWQLIDQEPDPSRRRDLEAYWLQLLRQYEHAVDTQRPAPMFSRKEAA